MRRIYLFAFLSAFLFVHVSYGQLTQDFSNYVEPLPDNQEIIFDNIPAPDCFLKQNFQEIIVPFKMKHKDDKLLVSLDTLTKYYDRSSSFAMYAYTVQNNNFPLVGSNTLYLFAGSIFINYSNSPIYVKEILVAYSLKHLNGPTDQLVAYVYRGDPVSGRPEGSPIGTGPFTLDDIDTNSTAPVFSAIKLNAPAEVAPNTKFVLMVQTRIGGSDDDFNIIFSNQQGDGNHESSACYLTMQNNQLLPGRFSDINLNMGGGERPNFDIMIMPVIDNDPVGVDDGFTLNGLTLKGNYPNPASDFSSLQLEVDNYTNIEINLIGIGGKVIKTLVNKYVSPGVYNFDIDLRDIPSGSYYYTIITNKSKVATKIIVNR